MSSTPPPDSPIFNQQAVDPERIQRMEKYVQHYFNQDLATANPQASLFFIQHLFEKILGESIPVTEIRLVMDKANFDSHVQSQETAENPIYNLAQEDIESLLRDWEQGKI